MKRLGNAASLARGSRGFAAQKLVYCVEHALRACSTQYTNSGKRHRREQAIMMDIRQILWNYKSQAAWAQAKQ
jgi:hypothetical protein